MIIYCIFDEFNYNFTYMSDKVFRLIKSMTPSEKRYFKVQSSMQGDKGNKSYVKLFDILEKQKEYKDDKTHEAFKEAKTKNQFYVFKRRLYLSLLKSLDAYHAESSVMSKVQKQLHYVDILFHKNLLDDATKLLQEIKSLCDEHHLYLQALESMEWRKKIRLQKLDALTELDDFYKEEKRLLEVLANSNEYAHLVRKIFALYSQHKQVRDAEDALVYDRFIEHPLLKDPALALSPEAKISFYLIYGLFFGVKGEKEKRYEASKKLIETIDAHPYYIKNNPERYMNLVYNHAVSAIYMSHYEEVEALLDRLKQLPQQFPKGEQKEWEQSIFERRCFLEMDYYVKSLQFEKAFAFAQEVAARLEDLSSIIGKDKIIVLYYDLALSALHAQEFKWSLKYLNKIINESSKNVKAETQISARILFLLTHFELGNDALLPYLVKSIYRFLLKRQQLYQFERIILRFLRKTPPVGHKQEMLSAFKNLKEELVPLLSDPYERWPFQSFDYITWLECKINGKDFQQTLKEKSSFNKPDKVKEEQKETGSFLKHLKKIGGA